MAKNFPHISDTEFPDVRNVDVYKYANKLDYSRWDASQMRVTLCSVPWDLGEAHIGQRTIQGVGNVVYFASKDERDAYFDGLSDDDCYRFVTKYRKFHSDDIIKVPVPVTSLADINYVEICYYKEPDADDPIEYESPITERWYYFIRDFERDASNTTRCNVMIDTWQTFIYDIDIPYMYLERGHYPIAQIDADTFLDNPIENTAWLSGEDASFGTLARAPHTEEVIHNNGTMYALIATTTSFSASQGAMYTTSWDNPGATNTLIQNAPAPTILACLRTDLLTLLTNIRNAAPQWLQGIQAVFMVSNELIALGSSFSFYDVTCYNVSASQQRLELIDLEKEQFGYPSEYQDLAKLYTYPYACLDIYTEDGSVTTINIEDTTGTLSIYRKLNLIYPYINLAAHVTGLGSGATQTLSFNDGMSATIGGRWYELLQDWDIPCYQVTVSSSTANEYETYWTRHHNEVAATNTQTSANASAATEQSNANASASTANTNENNLADTTVANAALNVTANNSINTRSNSAAGYDNNLQVNLNQAIQAWNAGYSRAVQRTEAEAAENSAMVSAATGAIGSTVSGAMSGGVVGAVGGLISGAISGASTLAQTAISMDASATKTEAGIANTQNQVTSTNTCSDQRTDNQQNANTDNTNYTNTAISSTAANNASTQITNAANTYSTETANAARTYNTAVANAQREYDTAIDANTAQVQEAALRAPVQFGTPSSGDTAATRPIASFATIRTQSLGAISQAGDMFLRYGYTCSRVVPFETFCVMPKFTFWQCSDLWLKSSYVPDAYMDQIRMLLFGGVTVWADPSDIGYTSIYENK